MGERKLTWGFGVVLWALCTAGCGPSAKVVGEGSTRPLLVVTSSLHLAYIGNWYQAVVSATGGALPYRWSISDGALPSGLSLDSSTGQIRGTPTVGGNFSVTFTATDASDATASKGFTLTVFEQPLDRYGGLVNAVSPNGATGFFHVEKNGGRWKVVDPLGHYMWLGSVYIVSDTGDGGTNYRNAVSSKYKTSSVWAADTVNRLKSWGFNVLGPGGGVGSHNIYPVGSPPNSAKMPFIAAVELSSDCSRSSTYKTKNLYNGLNSAVVSIARMFPDVFDPNWRACVAWEFSTNRGNTYGPLISTTESYLVGWWLGDADYLFGFGSGPNTPGKTHPNLGWVAAITNPTQTSGPGDGFGNLLTYTDTTVYSKSQWQAYIQNKYSTVSAMNAAWGSSYTSFGSAGGWPKKSTGGTGLMDEDGSSSWVPSCYVSNGECKGGSARMLADFHGFVSVIAGQYFSTARTQEKTYYPNHMVFGPGSINCQTYSEVLQKAGQYLDVVEVWVEPRYLGANGVNLANAYNVGGAPIYVWSTLQAGPDSETDPAKNWGAASPTCDILGGTTDYNYTTQALRGQCYQQLLNAYWAATGMDGYSPVVGIDWWEWVDKVTQGESANFGLVSQYDNAYDGEEDQVAAGADSWRYATGREPHNHGDFLDAVRQANLKILRALAGAR